MTVIVVMGVAGCGKSAVARKLAALQGVPWIEGDDFHPVANVHKMREGIPLDDTDREGWLQTLCDEIRKHPPGCVLACSALKRSYRDRLRSAAPQTLFVYLHGTPELLASRMAQRKGHYMPSSLLQSQLLTLQVPAADEAALAADISEASQDIVQRLLPQLRSLHPTP